MNAALLKQIEEIYQAVADIEVTDRHAFVKAKCGDDENLRREVESLLSYEGISDSFIDGPPDAIAAEMISEGSGLSPMIGTTIGHYEIRRLIGVGGMGEVYLAEDSQLNRQVALKVVPPSMLAHGDKIKRFRQEATASSALNHPNILTIHEFGTEGDTNYIVSEFVDGVTLREAASKGQFSITDTLDIAVQVASALSAAHRAGITHRDIKPENIMIRRDGIVKVLDFGLAKLTVPPGSHAVAGSEAGTLFKTEPGLIMGTASYMSPEQARGVNVDGRTDVWSLGVILYEMITGHLPFTGMTQTDVLVAILKQPVPTAEQFKVGPAADLKLIIDKSLAKDVAERYPTIDSMASDLKGLKNRLEFEAELKRSQGDLRRTDYDREGQHSALTERMPAAPATTAESGSEEPSRFIPNGKEKKRAFIPASIVALLIFAVAVGAVVWMSTSVDTSAPPSASPNPPTVPNAADVKPSRSLIYSLTVQSYTDGRYKNPFTLSGEMLFRNRDRVRLNIRSPQSGFLYILNQGPKNDGEEPYYNVLFPSPTANGGSAFLSDDQEIQIPQQSWFELDANEGTETVWLVWSKEEVSQLESAKKFANPEDRGRIKDLELNIAIDSLLERYRSNKPSVVRDDDKKESRISGNTDIVAHTIKLEHH